MKKRYLLALLPILCLTSCGNNGYAGTYKFMLGKEGAGESQIGLSMELTESDFVYYDHKPIKKTVATIDDLNALDKSLYTTGDIFKCVKIDDTNITHYFELKDAKFNDLGTERPRVDDAKPKYPDVPIGGSVAKLFKANVSIGNSVMNLPLRISIAISKGFCGYFTPTSFEDEKYGKRIRLGSKLNVDHVPGIEDIYTYIGESLSFETSDILRNALEGNIAGLGEISAEFIEYILTAFLNDKSLTIKVPVSMDDLQYQLAWYGLYVDIDPILKNKIHSISDVISNLGDIILSLAIKSKDLTQHERIHFKDDWKKEKVNMPGAQGEARFGTLPSTKVDESGFTESDYMNLYYAKEFSNTFVYNAAGDYTPIGCIIKRETQVGSSFPELIYYYPYDTGAVLGASMLSDKYIVTQDEYGTYKNYTKVNLDLDTSIADCDLGIHIAHVIDAANPEKYIDDEEFYRDPFTFRSFHTLPLALTK